MFISFEPDTVVRLTGQASSLFFIYICLVHLYIYDFCYLMNPIASAVCVKMKRHCGH